MLFNMICYVQLSYNAFTMFKNEYPFVGIIQLMKGYIFFEHCNDTKRVIIICSIIVCTHDCIEMCGKYKNKFKLPLMVYLC